MRTLAIAVCVLTFFSLARAADLNNADQTAVQQTITGQLEAFKKNDGTLAYSFAAPLVTKVFPTVDVFMSMVQRGYQPIYRNQRYSFGKLATDSLGRPAQHVTIRTADGKAYEAIYAMEKQTDGSWKISGVQMVEVPEIGA